MKNITAENQNLFYWWVDTDFCFEDFSVPKFALYCMEKNENNHKDRDTEELVFWAAYADVPGYDEAAENDGIQRQWDTIDAYIASKIGFLPEYDIN